MDPIEQGFRMQAFHAVEGILRLMRTGRDLYGDLDKLNVMLTAIIAGAGNVARDPVLSKRYAGPQPIPEELLRPISRQAVALAAGMSRETVRRMVAELVEEGRLVAEEGGVRAPEAVLSDPVNLEFARSIVAEFERTAERIRRAMQDATGETSTP